MFMAPTTGESSNDSLRLPVAIFGSSGANLGQGNNTWVRFNYDTEVYNAGFTKTNNTNITVPEAGRYLFISSYGLQNNSSVVNNSFGGMYIDAAFQESGTNGTEIKANHGYTVRNQVSGILSNVTTSNVLSYQHTQYGGSTLASTLTGSRDLTLVKLPGKYPMILTDQNGNFGLTTTQAFYNQNREFVKEASFTHSTTSNPYNFIVEPNSLYLLMFSLGINQVGTTVMNVHGTPAVNSNNLVGTTVTGMRCTAANNGHSANYIGLLRIGTQTAITVRVRNEAGTGNSIKGVDSPVTMVRLPENPAFRLFRSATSTWATLSDTEGVVPWNLAAIEMNRNFFDHSPNTNNSRVTIQRAGTYLFTGCIGGVNAGASYLEMFWRLNGAAVERGRSRAYTFDASNQTAGVSTGIVFPDLQPGDYIEVGATSPSMTMNVPCSLQGYRLDGLV